LSWQLRRWSRSSLRLAESLCDPQDCIAVTFAWTSQGTDGVQPPFLEENARELKGCHFEPIAYDAEMAAEPDWIWLPNTIVTGAAAETAPIHLLRQAQNPAAFE